MGISNYFIQTAALLTLMSLRIIFLDIYGQWLNKVGEEHLFNYRFTFTHSLPNPKPCQDFSGYGIFTLQLTGYKIFWGTIEGTRDMRHLGRISKGVVCTFIGEETVALRKKYNGASCSDHLSVVSDHLYSANSFPKYQMPPGKRTTL